MTLSEYIKYREAKHVLEVASKDIFHWVENHFQYMIQNMTVYESGVRELDRLSEIDEQNLLDDFEIWRNNNFESQAVSDLGL